MITFEEFTKVEMRIGKVLSAEMVEGSDKLLRLQVDFGDAQRQVITGIAKWYKPEQLVDKLFPFVTNLKHRRIMGLESQAMILAVGVDDKAVLLRPLKKVPLGSLLR